MGNAGVRRPPSQQTPQDTSARTGEAGRWPRGGVGHGGQQQTLRGPEEGEDEKLGQAAPVGDPLASSHPKETRQHLGHRD